MLLSTGGTLLQVWVPRHTWTAKSTGLQFWSSTTHLQLHSITTLTVILVLGYVSLLCFLSAPITSLQRCIQKISHP
ncbi:hypothetical protein CMV_020676 [Castanea mollissima]|uniref:Uncharacterized protein n=1 Tax=Castanea mollissima TaxID=60419 RepID=A0A8J4QL31_9ROSI|nr:hypothetical protein CMV_020676 [Castanea mollissima]